MSGTELLAGIAISFHGTVWNARNTTFDLGWFRTSQTPNVPLVVYACRNGTISVAAKTGHSAVVQGDACIVAPGLSHIVTGTANMACARIELDIDTLAVELPHLMVDRFDLARVVRSGRSAPIVIEGFYSDDLRMLLKRISYELGVANMRHPLTVRGMVSDLLISIEHALTNGRRRSLDIGAVCAYLEEHCTSVSLQETANRFYCHPNSISNLVKRETGMTFGELLTSIRLERVRTALETDPGRTVQDAAAACGYRNMTHFYTVFRNRYGMTPGEYRKRYARKVS